MKTEITIISDDLNHDIITEKEARSKLLNLLRVNSDPSIDIQNVSKNKMEEIIKKLSDIKLNDSIFYITKCKSFHVEKDHYGNQYHDGINFGRVEVKSIEIHESSVSINKSYNSYRGKYEYELLIPELDFNLDRFETDKSIYFADESLRNSIMKDMALNEIKQLETDIKRNKETLESKIRDIRKNYYSVLNH